jgi:hypothetical protein
LHGLHADVLALQELLGISYKDASHRLYMAKFEKLKVLNISEKAFSNLAMRTEAALLKLKQQMEMIEGSVDEDNVQEEHEDRS